MRYFSLAKSMSASSNRGLKLCIKIQNSCTAKKQMHPCVAAPLLRMTGESHLSLAGSRGSHIGMHLLFAMQLFCVSTLVLTPCCLRVPLTLPGKTSHEIFLMYSYRRSANFPARCVSTLQSVLVGIGSQSNGDRSPFSSESEI